MAAPLEFTSAGIEAVAEVPEIVASTTLDVEKLLVLYRMKTRSSADGVPDKVTVTDAASPANTFALLRSVTLDTVTGAADVCITTAVVEL